MKFALNTLDEIIHGSRKRRIHAIFVFLLWFAVGGYISATILDMFSGFDDDIKGSFIGGLIFSATFSFVKFT